MGAIVVRVADGVHGAGGVHGVDHGVNHSAEDWVDLAVCQDLVAAVVQAALVVPALDLWDLWGLWGLWGLSGRWVQEREGAREEAEWRPVRLGPQVSLAPAEQPEDWAHLEQLASPVLHPLRCRWGCSGLSWNRQTILPPVAACAAKSSARFHRDISRPGRR